MGGERLGIGVIPGSAKVCSPLAKLTPKGTKRKVFEKGTEKKGWAKPSFGKKDAGTTQESCIHD